MAAERKAIQIASRRFRTAASKLYNCDFADYNIQIERLVSCIESEPCINEFVCQCIAAADFKQEYIFEELQQVRGSWSSTFDNYTNEQKQAAFVYLILKAMLSEGKDIARNYGCGYARSKHFQDWANTLTSRFVSTLIDAVNEHLEEQLILSDTEEVKAPLVSVTGDQTQVNIADHSSQIEASMSNRYDFQRLEDALDRLLFELQNKIVSAEYMEAEELTEVIKAEARKNTPKKGILKAALTGLKGMAASANLTAAFITIEQAIQPLLG